MPLINTSNKLTRHAVGVLLAMTLQVAVSAEETEPLTYTFKQKAEFAKYPRRVIDFSQRMLVFEPKSRPDWSPVA